MVAEQQSMTLHKAAEQSKQAKNLRVATACYAMKGDGFTDKLTHQQVYKNVSSLLVCFLCCQIKVTVGQSQSKEKS